MASASGNSRAGHLNGIESQAARATSPLRLHFMICSPCPSHLASPYIPLPVSTSDPAPLSQDPRSQRTLLKTSFPIRPTARQLPAKCFPTTGRLRPSYPDDPPAGRHEPQADARSRPGLWLPDRLNTARARGGSWILPLFRLCRFAATFDAVVGGWCKFCDSRGRRSGV